MSSVFRCLLAGLLPLLLAALSATLGRVILSLVWIVSHWSSPVREVEAHLACLQGAPHLSCSIRQEGLTDSHESLRAGPPNIEIPELSDAMCEVWHL